MGPMREGEGGNRAVVTPAGSGAAPEMDPYASLLAGSDVLREPAIRAAIEWLQLPAASRGLDAGCGIGSHAVLLAGAVGPGGQVTGLDLSPRLLAYARRRVEVAGLADRVSFREGDVNELPFDDDAFDWAWSVDCVGYAPQLARTAVPELVRVVKPGGRVALLAWSSQQLLPGYPRLEARLNATVAGIAPFVQGMRPESHFLRGLGWLRAAGLRDVRARSFLCDVQAPLGDEVRQAVVDLFGMRWGRARGEVSAEDWAAYRRLTEPGSPEFLLDRADYYAFFTYSAFAGTVVK